MAITTITMEQIKSWMDDNSISILDSISLSPDRMGTVKEFITEETLTGEQITSFKELFFNTRVQGNMGADITSDDTITLTRGNLFSIKETNDINYITTTNWKPGSIICLKFLDGNITLTHNASNVPANTAAMFLNTGNNGSFPQGSVLTLIYDGTYWREIARMIT